MEYWNERNTVGFNRYELRLINQVFDQLVVDTMCCTTNINDAINNAWQDGITYNELLAASKRNLGVRT